MSKKVLNYSTGILLTLIGLSAVVVGALFIWNPSGGMGLTTDLLQDSPFSSFLIPGVFLFVINGLGSLVVAYYVFKDHRYAGISTLVLGILMMVWIAAQVYWIGWASWLQPTFLAVGAIEIILGFFLNHMHPENGLFGSHHGSHAH